MGNLVDSMDSITTVWCLRHFRDDGDINLLFIIVTQINVIVPQYYIIKT